MGWDGVPVYPTEIASAIETAKILIAKIESNKYDSKDLKELAEVNAEIIKYATSNENQD